MLTTAAAASAAFLAWVRGGKGEMDTSCVGKPYFELCHLKVIPMLIFLGSVVVNLCGVQR